MTGRDCFFSCAGECKAFSHATATFFSHRVRSSLSPSGCKSSDDHRPEAFPLSRRRRQGFRAGAPLPFFSPFSLVSPSYLGVRDRPHVISLFPVHETRSEVSEALLSSSY